MQKFVSICCLCMSVILVLFALRAFNHPSISRVAPAWQQRREPLAQVPMAAAPGVTPAARAAAAARFAEPAPAPTPQSTSTPPALQAARAYRAGKSSISFSRTDLLQDLLAHDEEAVQHLGDALATAPAEGAAEEAPNTEVLDRMAAIDLLEGLAEEAVTATNQGQARRALQAVALQEVPVGLDTPRNGVMVAEKYDAFTALTRIEPSLAMAAYRGLGSAARREVLKPAVLAGLVDRGVPRSEVTATFERLAAGF